MHMTPTLAEFAVAPLSAPTVLIRLGPPGAAAAGCSVQYSLHLRFRRPYSVESPNEPNIRTTRQLGFAPWFSSPEIDAAPSVPDPERPYSTPIVDHRTTSAMRWADDFPQGQGTARYNGHSGALMGTLGPEGVGCPDCGIE
ncbi:hypothetical protein BD779DRAFT_1475419 [Infundibulicybe gibba]|nr:hypothetical protein BD779DRAFT_1475419 [Infundibulicybe gibba]